MTDTIPTDWESCAFGKLAKVINGYAFKSSEFKDSVEGSYPIIRMSNLKEGALDLNNAVYAHHSSTDGLEKFKLTGGEFLFGMSGSLSNFAIVKDAQKVCYQNQRVGRIEAQAANQTYVNYLFQSEKLINEILNLSAGGAQQNISAKQIEEITVLVAPLVEQEKIADILTSVDDTIEHTQAQVAKLQDLKTATMNELLMRGIGHTEFKESDLGLIPTTWETKDLRALCELHYGKSPKEVESETGEYTLWGTGGEIGYSTSCLCEVPSVIIGRKGSIGTPYFADAPFWAIDTTYFTTFDDLVDAKWFFYKMVHENLERYSEATGVPSLNRETLYGIKTSVPPLVEQEKIADILTSLDDQIESVELKLVQLESLKKSLMGDLLTGRVRVSVD